MANTLTNLQARIFADSAILAFNKWTAPLTAFSRGFNAEASRKGDTVRVPVFTRLKAKAFGATGYKGDDLFQAGADIALNVHKLTTFGITDREAAESPANYFRDLGYQAGKATAEAVVTDVMGDITAANYLDVADVDKVQLGATAALTTADVGKIRKALAEKGVRIDGAALVLDHTRFNDLLSSATMHADSFGGTEAIRSGVIPSLFGFSQVIECGVIPANGEKLVGFACAPQAIGVAMRYLMPQVPGSYDSTGMVSDAESGAVLGVRIYGDPQQGVKNMAVEALYGHAALDKPTAAGAGRTAGQFSDGALVRITTA